MSDVKEVTAKSGVTTEGLGERSAARPSTARASDAANAQAGAAQQGYQPIVLDMGKARTKRLKEIYKGEGKLTDQIHDAIQQVRASFGADAHAEFVPVVLIYRNKPKKRRFL